MNHAIFDRILIILFAILGLAAFAWGVAQLVGYLPMFNSWSDIAGMLLGLNLIGAAWLLRIGKSMQVGF